MLSAVFVVLDLCHLIGAHLRLRLPSGIGSAPARRCVYVLYVALICRHLTIILATVIINLGNICLKRSLVLPQILIDMATILLVSKTIDGKVWLHCLRIGLILTHID